MNGKLTAPYTIGIQCKVSPLNSHHFLTAGAPARLRCRSCRNRPAGSRARPAVSPPSPGLRSRGRRPAREADRKTAAPHLRCNAAGVWAEGGAQSTRLRWRRRVCAGLSSCEAFKQWCHAAAAASWPAGRGRTEPLRAEMLPILTICVQEDVSGHAHLPSPRSGAGRALQSINVE